MTTFRHTDASPADSAWLSGPLVETRWLHAPSAADDVVVLAAHPDDETLGAGGLIAAAHAAGARISVVVATDGEASHPASLTHTPEALARRRRVEVTEAVRCLAPTASLHFLGLPDGQLDRVGRSLAAKVGHLTATATHVVAPWEGDRHPDHAACGRAAAAAAREHGARCWQYPIWAWHWADPHDAHALPWDSLSRLQLSPQQRSAKHRAIAAHASQHSPLSDQRGDEPVIAADMVAHFRRSFESFFVDDRVHDAGDAGYFDRLYADADDPWGLASRFYEVRKRSLLLASLPRTRFGSAFEPGCATGLLTAALAERCADVLAWDVADKAVASTSRRLAGLSNVRVERGGIPDEWPEGAFDLVVLSEVGYYCRDLDDLARRAWTGLADDGVLVACHWRHCAPDHPHTADEVHTALDRPQLRVVHHVEDDFLLDVWSTTGRSVAAQTGVVA